MKRPEDCSSIQEVRAEIDRLDRQVLAALGERAKYVSAAARFKTDEASVKGADRFAAMLRERRSWAEEEGLSPDVVEKLFRDLVSYFIERELSHWKASQ